MDELQARKETLLAQFTTLASALEHADSRPEAAEALRGLVMPSCWSRDGEALRIELKGNLAAMLAAATNAKRSPEGDLSLQIAMVAGARRTLYRRLCWTAA